MLKVEIITDGGRTASERRAGLAAGWGRGGGSGRLKPLNLLTNAVSTI